MLVGADGESCTGGEGEDGVGIALGEPSAQEGFSCLGDRFLCQEGECHPLILLSSESPQAHTEGADIT